jgi:hypothetical protein
MELQRVCPGCDRAIQVPAEEGDAACPLCGHIFTIELPAEPDVPGLATAVRYPFSSPGALTFLALTVPLYAVCRVVPFFPFNVVGQVILGGYIAQWLWEILTSTAQGRHVAPGAPLSGPVHELVGNFFRFFGALVVAFAPAAIYSAVLFCNDSPPGGPAGAGAALLALAGMLYYPMALLLIGFSERWSEALHLVFAVRSIRRIGWDYLLCCIFFFVTFGVSTAVEAGIAVLPGGAGFEVRFLARFAAVFVEVLLYAIQMRAVGLVYLANKDKLGWFR